MVSLKALTLSTFALSAAAFPFGWPVYSESTYSFPTLTLPTSSTTYYYGTATGTGTSYPTATGSYKKVKRDLEARHYFPTSGGTATGTIAPYPTPTGEWQWPKLAV
jgi:hypothetical protein